MMGLRWLLLLWVVLAPAVSALPLLDLASSHEAIGEAVAVLEDPGGQLGAEQVLRLPPERFVPLGQPVASHTFTRSAYWYRFDVENRQAVPVSRILWLV